MSLDYGRNGVDVIGAIIREGEVRSVFPQRTKSKSPMVMKDGKKKTKYRRGGGRL